MTKALHTAAKNSQSRVRIIGGTWRSRLIDVPSVAGDIALRPTPDRVRETLFNWLGQKLAGRRCLDLFAGTGALGFEAASRGAEEVVMVENAPRIFHHLQQTTALLKADNIRLVRGEALSWLQSNTQRFDVIFLDPPYHQGWLEKLAPFLSKALEPDGFVYAEAEHPVTQLVTRVAPQAGVDSNTLKCVKSGHAGQVHYQLLSYDAD